MSLTGQSVAPQRRAFGMGVFFSFYFVLMSLGPPAAGWLFDLSGDPFRPILFATVLFVCAALVYRLFRVLKGRASAA